MGLYLCVFDVDDEVEGVEIGSYDDFSVFRDTVCDRLEGGVYGSRFPVLMGHSDCDGEWSAAEAAALMEELSSIAEELAREPPVALPDGWKRSVASAIGLSPKNLLEGFFDVDGEPLIERLQGLCRCSVQRGLPILFQ